MSPDPLRLVWVLLAVVIAAAGPGAALGARGRRFVSAWAAALLGRGLVVAVVLAPMAAVGAVGAWLSPGQAPVGAAVAAGWAGALGLLAAVPLAGAVGAAPVLAVAGADPRTAVRAALSRLSMRSVWVVLVLAGAEAAAGLVAVLAVRPLSASEVAGLPWDELLAAELCTAAVWRCLGVPVQVLGAQLHRQGAAQLVRGMSKPPSRASNGSRST